MGADRVCKILRDEIERFVPRRFIPVDSGREETILKSQRIFERGALGTETAEICGMLHIARHRPIGLNDKPATNAAIRTSGVDAHTAAPAMTGRPTRISPSTSFTGILRVAPSSGAMAAPSVN